MADRDLVPVPEILPRNERAWERVKASSLGERMKRALRRVATGESYREAAQAEGYGTHSEIYRNAKRYGLSSATSERIVERCRNVADLSLQELERRLAADPEAFSTKELDITAGIMTDKIAKRERWGTVEDHGSSEDSPLLQLARAVAEGKLGARLEVHPRPERPEDLVEAIYTVEPDGGRSCWPGEQDESRRPS